MGLPCIVLAYALALSSSPTVVLTHTKSEGRLDSHQLFLDYASSAVEETRWSVEERLLPPWLALKPTSGILPAGQAEGGLFVVSAAPNVPERIEPYRSSVHLTLTSDAFNDTFVAVPILLIVAPATSAHHSMWGEAQLVTGSAGGGGSAAYRCDRHRQKPPLPSTLGAKLADKSVRHFDEETLRKGRAEQTFLGVDVGVEQAVVFTACDSEGLRVSHSLPSEGLRVAHAIWKPEEVEEVRQHHGPQAWQVVLRDRASGQERKIQYVYSSSGRYEATVAAPLVGEYELLLFLDWTHESARGERRLSENVPEGGGRWSREPVDTLYLVARCPPPLVPLPSRECGCPAGYEDHGYMACEPCAFGTHKPQPGNDACIPETWPVIVTTFGTFLGLVLLVVLLVYARRGWQRHLLASAAADRENACKQKRIRHAVLKVTTLEHPLAVMPLFRLRELGSLVSYEEARDAGALRCCDTVQSAVAFAVRHPLVFVSHQWLSLTHPDPESLHYPRLAIGSIPFCVACSHYFVVCAPEAQHLGSNPPSLVNAETYLQRGWCRLEQWAFLAINGAEQMYVFETALAHLSQRRRWIEESVNVFQGSLPSPGLPGHFTHEEDKALLVDVVLGLYGLAVVAAIDPSVASSGRGVGRTSSLARSELGRALRDRHRDALAGSVEHGVVARCAEDGRRCGGGGLPASSVQRLQCDGGGAASSQLVELIAERRSLVFPREHFGDLVDRLEAELEWAALTGRSSASETYHAARSARMTLRISLDSLEDGDKSVSWVEGVKHGVKGEG
ncbi:hypothetical protein EMIHUDRAFT_448355 [Emiliania huxleyi CCMP1516]|uniref:Tyrosine-protein kinase ephrin type A/B receptor-like domain-containing protein n=2 Tax=Emiliania huxleyi TaxID=2903 RepID=A0A0D3IDT7_EMIH1|nr:hypothetical protein EMIHUDRAFT_448355 [Emiliania huxleyi CCMP1516]EOD09422.1 hypothetical protein EMIHUDRAFT_448355 [Emiliania huxleyi CCMP1516]|eukprot:XP_005761851.1 hypothetical protein EMIHUDRAFT_448355 [Emiliania huxleyi CCMP1516]